MLEVILEQIAAETIFFNYLDVQDQNNFHAIPKAHLDDSILWPRYEETSLIINQSA